jgi:hypothetical protein
MCVGAALSPIGSGLRPLALLSPAAALFTGGLFKKKSSNGSSGGFGNGPNPNGSLSYGS